MVNDDIDRKRMSVALAANMTMFFVGLVGRHFAKSTSLLADAFDMCAWKTKKVGQYTVQLEWSNKANQVHLASADCGRCR